MEKGLALNKKEERRLNLIVGIEAKELTLQEVAYALDLSERQVWRLLGAYRLEQARGLAHRNRGRASPRRIPEEVRRQVVALAKSRYDGANDCHLTDLLHQREGMALSRPTVRRILREAGVGSPRRHRSPKHRSRRERYAQEGMLLQIDGSFHPWLEERGPKLCLLGAMDDATGQMVAGVFRDREDTQGYFLLLEAILKAKGIPQALYSDRHSIFQRAPQDPETLEEQLAGKRQPTQFGEALQALGIRLLLAHSPQAKGRIERLWGTLQSRLVIELRLAGASTLQEANVFLQSYLPRFNEEFRVPAAEPGVAYRPLGPALCLEEVLCFKYYRTVALDNTVTLDEQAFQLLPGPGGRSYARRRVEIQERLDGSIVVFYQGARVASHPAPEGAVLLRARRHRGDQGSKDSLVNDEGHVPVAPSVHEQPRLPAGHTTPWKPAPNHPWRK
jgi:transposase